MLRMVGRSSRANFLTQFPLPMRREIFELIVSTFNLPPSYLDVLHRDTTTFVKMQLGYGSGSSDLEGEKIKLLPTTYKLISER